ncbi:MAG: cysteine desulfurase family protein [Patescibacteria group bacterium]
MKHVYLDHAATTYLRKEVLNAMAPYFYNEYGNPSSFHSVGKKSKDAIETARFAVAKILNCRSAEIIFTGGGTESDNLAILGAARANKEKGKHIITSKIEHPAILDACKALEKEGFEVSYIPVDKMGIIKLEEFKKALRSDTVLVSIMYANNEIGTIQPIKEAAKIIREHRQKNKTAFPSFHTDACQAAGALDLDTVKLGVDLLTINGSKIYGPKGIGVLYVKKGINLQPLIYGGGQEQGIRSGTENVPSIIGLAKALEMAQSEKEKENIRISKLRDALISGIIKKIPRAFLNGDPKKRLPNNANLSIPKVEGEAMVLYLDSKGIYASTGSACSSRSLKPSHVLLAIGLNDEMAHSSLRLTLGKKTTREDIGYVIKILPGIVEKLREVSSL